MQVKKLAIDWRLAQLEVALKRASDVQRDFLVVDELVEAAPAYPGETIRCLDLLIEGGGVEPMALHSWVHSGEIAAVLRAGLTSSDKNVEAQTRALTNRLVARGFNDLLALLKPPTP